MAVVIRRQLAALQLLYTGHSLRAHSIGSPSVNLRRIDDKVKKKN